MDLEKLFWESSIDELEKGYKTIDSNHICLICGEVFEEGIIYSNEDKLMEAKKAIISHIKVKHNSMFDYLVNMDKKYTGLTDAQKSLVTMFASKMNDKEIAKELDASPSTIRNHRFTLREKAKQAKIFLTLMNLMENDNIDNFVTIHRFATHVDERYAITEVEKADTIQKYFDEHMKLTTFPTKQKRIIIVLQVIAERFDSSKVYDEKAVNEIIKAIFNDFVTIRRYLIEYGFLARTQDCKEYWVKK
jgi:hypothetical protein